MPWSSLLLSISLYTWYLFFYTALELKLPVLLAGPFNLLLIGIIPALAAYWLNTFLAGLNRTIFKAVVINALVYLAVALVTAWVSSYFAYLPTHSDGLPSWPAWLLPFIWQLFSWFSGYGFSLAALGDGGGGQLSVRVLEACLFLAVPAIFLLAFSVFPGSFLAGVIICWFIVMALSLALEGAVLNSSDLPRYDIIFFHIFVPILVGGLIFLVAFSQEFWALLEGGRSALAALGAMILRFLSSLATPQEGEPLVPEQDAVIMEEESAQGMTEISPLVLPLLAAAAILVGVIALATFISWLRTRLKADPVSPRRKAFHLTDIIFQLGYYLVFLLSWTGNACRSLLQKTKTRVHSIILLSKRMVLRLLPPRTPYEKIKRSYFPFLKWIARRGGIRIKPWETPLEYIKRLQGTRVGNYLPWEKVSLLTEIYLEARYSPWPASWQMGEKSAELLREIKKHGASH